VLHVGLDLSRRRVDVCLLSEQGELLGQFPAPADRDGLHGLARRVGAYGQPVRGVIESMNGARFVHDELLRHGWEVLIADAQRVKGLAPLACKTDKVDSRVLAELSFRDLVPAIWLPGPQLRREREVSRYRLHLVRHRTSLKNRIHSTLICFGHQCPVSDLFGVSGRELLERLQIPQPWARPCRCQRCRDRRSDAPDRSDRAGARALRCGPSLRAAAFDRTRVRVGGRLHRRVRDRRDQPVLHAGQAGRLHRPVPAGQAVRRHGPPRSAVQARTQVPAVGADGGLAARAL
jgi:hypothetical protein